MTTAEFEYICRFVRDRSGLVLETGKEYLVDARLTPVASQSELASVSELISKLRTAPNDKLVARVIEAMVTNETSFFRDVQPFETFRKSVLPELIARRRDERRLNVWFSACSTGQEPYSFALLIREHFPELTNWRLDLMASDLSTEALARARAGRYIQIEVNRGLPASLLVKYFRQHGPNWELDETVRQMVTFREMNLVQPWPLLAKMDIVFLRNVMIYFDVETKRSILGRVAKLLRPDGYLLLGGAETTMNLDDRFRRVDTLKGGFHQLVG